MARPEPAETHPEAVAQLARWVDSPRDFVAEELGVTPDAWQDEALEHVRRGCIRLALKACKGPGKTAVLAWLVWWWLLTRPRSKVVCTSITADNLRDNLWTELAKWQARSPILQAQFRWTKERIEQVDAPEEWWASARAWPKDADATAQADALAGVHADHVLFVLDESGGIPRAVMATAEAGLANANPAEGRTALLVQAGNPTSVDGPLFDACGKDRALWAVVEITSDPDSPRRTPRVSVQWAREQIAKYGRDNPWVLVNVFGRFPPGSSDALLALEDVLESSRRVLPDASYRDEARILGVDVARFGDDRSVLALRQGRCLYRLSRVYRNLDTMTLASQVARAIDELKPDAVFVDVTGIGAGVVDRLLQLGYSVIGVEFGGAASGPRWANKRTEMWDTMADWVRGGGCIPDDAELIAEMPAPKYAFAANGKMQLEAKKAMKARGLSSPDKADAVALTFAFPVAAPVPGLPGASRTRQADTEYEPYA